jgi:Flp pilus assembly protein TadD
VYNQTSLVVSVFLIGSIAVTMPPVTQAQVSLMPHKSSPEVRQLLSEGRKLVDTGDYSGAIAVYQQAASLEPKNATIYSGIGYLYAQQGNFPSALAAYRRAVSLNPNNGDYQYALGYIDVNLGDTKAAKEAYRRAIQLNRSNVNAYLGLATALFTGRSAKEICIQLFEETKPCPVSRLDHAAYLGREFMRAELALVIGQDYVQD